MNFPKTQEIYEYKGKEYVVLAQTIFSDVYVQEVLKEDRPDGSHFYSFGWWSFVFNSKHIGTTKKNDAY